jgi:transcriptional regulator with AAA-type ATPase domain
MNRKKEETKPKELVIVRKQKDGTEVREKTGLTKEEFVEMVKVVSLGEKIIKEIKKELAGISENIEETCKAIFRASQYDRNVLILGETGTGKEIVAREIYNHSKRREDQKLVIMQPAGLTDTIADAELFGSVRGAYTGAVDRHGLVAEANGGTLFIDEIAYLPLPVQSKLLRLTQFKTYRRLGEVEEKKSDFRLICATNRPLEGMGLKPAGELINSPQTTFLPDLYWRIAEVEIKISPLRERREDILPIFLSLIERHYPDIDIKKLSMSWNSLYCLLMSDWVGNVRELENVVRRNPIRQRKLVKETVYFPFGVVEQLKRTCSFQHERYDMSDPVTGAWGDELINVVTFAKKLKGAPILPFWKAPERRSITSLSDFSYFDVEKILVDEGRKLEALPKYKEQREEYQEEKRKLEAQRIQHPPSLLGGLRNLGFDMPGLSMKDCILEALRSSQKQTTPASDDSLDALAKEATPLSEIEKRYLKKFLSNYPIKKGKKGGSLLSRANMLGMKPKVLDRMIKKYSL